jgi:hypothetical protein
MTTPKLRPDEIKARLVAWQETPESERPSLRGLAAEMGVSHQLLSHHLKGLEHWRIEQRRLELKRERESMWERVNGEHRLPTEDEYARITGILREEVQLVVTPLAWKAIERSAQSGKLSKRGVKWLQARARAGDPRAQEIVDRLHLGQAPSVKRGSRVW